MRLLLIILFSLIGLAAYSQTYTRDGLGIKWIQLEGCRKVSNGQPADSCFVMTNGINGKLSRCLHISELRALITGGIGPTDSTYLVDNGDGSYSLFNENGTEYPFGYKFEEVGDTIFLTDLDGHRADTLVMSLLDNQTLSWDPGTGDLGIANGNTVNLDGRYLLSEVDGDPTNELQFVDSFYTSNDSLFISLDRDSVAPSFVVLNPGADGNGIYGGSGEVPNNTYAHVPLTNDFAIGHFRSFPGSVETSDRGLWLSGNEFYLYANDSLSGGLARIYTSNLDIINVSTLDSAESYFHVDPDRATVFSEDGINATNITARPDSLDMYSRLWTPEFDSARLRLETTYGNPGDVLTSDGMYMRWSAPTGGFTLDSVILRLSGNVLESKVNTTSDTSLVIGYLNSNLSGNTITNNVNGVTDTVLVIGSLLTDYANGVLTTTVNGVQDTAQIPTGGAGVTTNTLSLSGNVMTSNVEGISDTSLVIGQLLTNLSGNTTTTTVNGLSDTSLVIGEHTITFNDPILTSSVNGITDTAIISVSAADGNGIYGGSGTVPDLTYAQIGTLAPHSNIAQDSVFAIGYHPSFPNVSTTNSRGLFWDSFASGFYIMGADTVNNSYTYTNYTGSQYTTSRNSSTGEISEVNIGPAYVNYDVYDGTDTSMIDILLDSIDMSSMKLHANVDTLRLKIGGTYGTNGYVLTSDGTNAEWAAATGGAQSNAIDLSSNVITSNVDGQIDTTLVIGTNTLGLSGNQLTTNVNGVSDTSLVIGQNSLSFATGTRILTSVINGVSDTTTIPSEATTNTLGLSGNVMTSTVNGVSDTSLVIGVVNSNLSGNVITNNVNGVTDTTLVIGQVLTNLSGNTTTTTINGVSDTSLVIGNNTLSYGTSTKILTSSINGISDTTTLTGLGDILNGGNTTGAAIRIGTNDGFGLSLIVNASDAITFSAAIADARSYTQFVEGTATTSVIDGVNFAAESTGAAAAGFGIGTEYLLESSTTTNRSAGRFSNYWTTATDASREAAFGWQLGDNGGALAEVMKLDMTDAGGVGQLSLGTSSPVLLTSNKLQTQGSNSLYLNTAQTSSTDIYLYPDTTHANSNGNIFFYANEDGNNGGFQFFNRYQNGTSAKLSRCAGYASGTTLGNSVYEEKVNWTAADNVRYETYYVDNGGTVAASIVGAKFTNRTSDYADYYIATRSASGLNEKIYILSTGQIGFGNSAPTAPTAWVNIAAGTATASTAPLKFTSGTNLSVAEAGAVEYDGTHLYITNSTPTRAKVLSEINTATLTNKRITKRVGTTTSTASLTIDSDATDNYTVTALAVDMTINAPTGTPTDGQMLIIRILDNGSARLLNWNAAFAVIGTTLPTTTTAGKLIYVGCIWNSASSKWDVVSVNVQV